MTTTTTTNENNMTTEIDFAIVTQMFNFLFVWTIFFSENLLLKKPMKHTHTHTKNIKYSLKNAGNIFSKI